MANNFFRLTLSIFYRINLSSLVVVEKSLKVVENEAQLAHHKGLKYVMDYDFFQ
jgi:hypothetical protein